MAYSSTHSIKVLRQRIYLSACLINSCLKDSNLLLVLLVCFCQRLFSLPLRCNCSLLLLC